jgi:hypothetical protein
MTLAARSTIQAFRNSFLNDQQKIEGFTAISGFAMKDGRIFKNDLVLEGEVL